MELVAVLSTIGGRIDELRDTGLAEMTLRARVELNGSENVIHQLLAGLFRPDFGHIVSLSGKPGGDLGLLVGTEKLGDL